MPRRASASLLALLSETCADAFEHLAQHWHQNGRCRQMLYFSCSVLMGLACCLPRHYLVIALVGERQIRVLPFSKRPSNAGQILDLFRLRHACLSSASCLMNQNPAETARCAAKNHLVLLLIDAARFAASQMTIQHSTQHCWQLGAIACAYPLLHGQGASADNLQQNSITTHIA